METLARFVVRPEYVIYLANLATMVSLICGIGLLAVWVCRRCSTPLRHGILISLLALTLLCPMSVWLGQQRGLALIWVGVPLSETAGQPDISSALAPTSTSRSGSSILSAGSEHGVQERATALTPQSSGVDSSMRPVSDPSKATPAASGGPGEGNGRSVLPLPYRGGQSPWWQVLGTVAVWAWAVGILVGVLRLGFGYAALMRIRRSFGRLPDPRVTGLARQAATDMGLREAPPLFISPLVPIPISLGLVRPAIVLPTDITLRMDDAQLQAILVHEMAHICRLDPWVGLAQRIAVVVFWWNPLVRRVSDRVSGLREDLCDNYVVRVQGNGEDFARTLVDVASHMMAHPVLPATVGVLESNLDGLTERIHRLVTKERDMATRMSIGSMLLVLTCALTILFGTGLIRCLQAAEVASATLMGAQKEKNDAKLTTTPVGADDVVDPNTGLRFDVSKTITGANDVIESDNGIILSPNGKFLLWSGHMVPLDGSPAFTLKELKGAGVASWSPDGQKIAFHSEGIEILPISPDTGRPTGAVRRLLEEIGGWDDGKIYWSADSERILFVRRNLRRQREVGAITLRDSRLDEKPNYADFGLVSPDGKMIAYSVPDDGIWTRSVPDGTPRIAHAFYGRSLFDDPEAWTSDSQWVVSAVDGWIRNRIHFARLANGQGFDVSVPEIVGTFVGKSTEGKKLYFYHSSFDLMTTSKVIPISGGSAFKVGPNYFWPYHYCWPLDSASLAVIEMEKGGSQRLWSIPLTGGDRVQFNMESLGKDDERYLCSLSPDSQKLLYITWSGQDQGINLYVVPISLKEGRATGPATLAFKGWRPPNGGIVKVGAWSPDGTRIAMPHQTDEGIGHLILFADGSRTIQLTHTANEVEQYPQWSPDGKMIAFNLMASDREMLQVIPAEGGTARTIMTTPKGQSSPFGWSPDSKEVVVASNGTISGFPIAAGSARVIVKLQDAGYESASWLGWSPDGQRLAFYGGKKNEAGRLCLFSPNTGMVEKLENSPDTAQDFLWSPDGTMICCTVKEPEKARPAGIVRELDLMEAVKKAPLLAEKQTGKAATAPQAEPISGPVFTDNFDNGPSKHWLFQDSPKEGLGPGRHAVENGELMLSCARACLDGIDWTDYVVTVRVCMKESVASGEAVFGITARATPSQFGSSRKDRYSLLFLYVNNTPRYLLLDLNYYDASDTLRHGRLSQSPCNIVRDKWYTLEFEVRGQHLQGYLDGKLVLEATDTRLSKGGVWLNTYNSRVLFDDFSVRQLP